MDVPLACTAAEVYLYLSLHRARVLQPLWLGPRERNRTAIIVSAFVAIKRFMSVRYERCRKLYCLLSALTEPDINMHSTVEES